MSKVFFSTALLVLAAFLSSGHASNHKPTSEPSQTFSVQEAAPEVVFSANLERFGPTRFSLTCTWEADNGGPFTVQIFNITTGVLVQTIVTNGNSATFNNLIAGNFYRCTVSDLNSSVNSNVVFL